MKRQTIILTFILILITKFVFAHEETYKSIQLSNLHLKIMVGYEESYQLDIAKAYAPIINDFIKGIDNKQKVFIQFDEDYCSLNDDYILLSIGSFKNSLIPLGFPFSYPYDLGFIKNEQGLNLILSQSNFKLKPILELIKFGLENKKFLIKTQKHFKLNSDNIHPITKYRMSKDFNERIKSIDIQIIDSVINGKNNKSIEQYVKRKVSISKSVVNNYGIQITLVNDSIIINNNLGDELLNIETLQYIIVEEETKGIFVFDTEKTFYFINKDLKVLDRKNTLTFSIKNMCENVIFVIYDFEKKEYKLSNAYYEDNSTIDYFDIEKGIKKKE